MLTVYLMSGLLMFLSGLLVFSLNHKHLLLMLLSLEYMVLSVFMNLIFWTSFYNNEYFFSMIFLTFSVCEGALGLALLVSLMRSHGNDYFQSFSLLW